jgi:hypothetical protein
MDKVPAGGRARQLHHRSSGRGKGGGARTVRLSDVKVTTYEARLGHEWVCVVRGIREADRIPESAAAVAKKISIAARDKAKS